jgi:hypothetical protein
MSNFLFPLVISGIGWNNAAKASIGAAGASIRARRAGLRQSHTAACEQIILCGISEGYVPMPL